MQTLLVHIFDSAIILALSASTAWGLSEAFDLTEQQIPWLAFAFISFFYGLRYIKNN